MGPIVNNISKAVNDNSFGYIPFGYLSKELLQNPLEEKITRKEYHSNIFSIDPEDCMDIDDALSIETRDNITIIGVHIAQPICWLSEDDIKTRMKTKGDVPKILTSLQNQYKNSISN